MSVLLFLGVLGGAAYSSAIWLVAEHGMHPHSAWNLLAVPIGVGGVALFLLFVWVLLDALQGSKR